MIRLAVTVVLAVAVLAAATPAIESGRIARTEAQVNAAVDDVDAAALDLLAAEDPVERGPGARRVVTVRLPSRGVAAAEVEALRIGSGGRYAYRIGGAPERVRYGRAPVHTADGEPLVLREDGSHRLVLRLVERNGERVVVVERVRTPA